MLLLETFLIMAMITLLLIVTVVALRDARHLLQGRLFAALCGSVAALYLSVLPPVLGAPYPLLIAARLVAVLHLGLLWWFSLSLLRDDFRLDWLAWLGMVLLSLAPLIYVIELLGAAIPYWDYINVFGGVMPFVLVAHVVWVALSERHNDLLEPRRKARFWLTLWLMLVTLVSVLAEYLEQPQMEFMVRNIAIMPMVFVALIWLLRMDPAVLRFEPQQPKPKIDPMDQALHQRLTAAMETQQLYLSHGLSINQLAAALDSQEHRLRSLINQGLGYRNFAAFMNHFRLEHAKQLLADPNLARRSVLQIAMDSGFTSLATFNRVFRAQEACSPTDFRKQALLNIAQN